MTNPVLARPIQPEDFAAWLPLWDGYNAFYGRHGKTALPLLVTQSTWQRFFDPDEPVFAVVAVSPQGQLVGLAHYLYHRSTTRIEPTCYLQDLFTLDSQRGRGIGRALIEAVAAAAKTAKIKRLYWQTHRDNSAGRRLYDKVAEHTGFIVYSRDLT